MPSDISATAQNIPAARLPEYTFRSLVRAFGTGRQLMEPFFAQFGISTAQWGILRAILRAEEEGVQELRLTDLSTRLLIRPPSVTTVIDRMELAGVVLREASPTDRRAKTIALTPKGRAIIMRVLATYDAQIFSVMGALSPDEQRQMSLMLDRLNAHLARMASENLRTGAESELDPL